MNASVRNGAALALLACIVPIASRISARAGLAQAQGSTAPANANTKEIRVLAKKYEYDPAVITVQKGDRVKLIITAIDHDHGFKIEAFHIDQLLKQGESTSIEFGADTAGTFPFQCSHFCGLGHKGMKGQLIVKEAAQ